MPVEHLCEPENFFIPKNAISKSLIKILAMDETTISKNVFLSYGIQDALNCTPKFLKNCLESCLER